MGKETNYARGLINKINETLIQRLSLTPEELFNLNKKGLIPGPNESEEFFLTRIQAWQNLPRSTDELESDVKHQAAAALQELLDVSPVWISCFYSNKELSFWQGAVTWEVEEGISFPLIQLRKNFRRGSYLGIYKREEILMHEMVHAVRFQLHSTKFEELMAYRTSPYPFRRWLGPLFNSPGDCYLFLSLSSLPMLVGFFSFFSAFYLFSFIWFIFFYRLSKRHRLFRKCLDQLEKVSNLKTKGLAVICRLTDEEIELFAKSSPASIAAFAEEQKDQSLRWKMIHLSYFIVD